MLNNNTKNKVLNIPTLFVFKCNLTHSRNVCLTVIVQLKNNETIRSLILIDLKLQLNISYQE